MSVFILKAPEAWACWQWCDATTPINTQQGVQTDATCNIQRCWELLANNVASVCVELYIVWTPYFHLNKAWRSDSIKLSKG